MGMAAALIRLRYDEDPQTIPTHILPGCCFTFMDLSEMVWKTRVDLCPLLIVSVPVLAQVLPPLPPLPGLGLLANILFVLPQLIIITGDLTFQLKTS